MWIFSGYPLDKETGIDYILVVTVFEGF